MAEKKSRINLLGILCAVMAAGVGLFMWQHYFANKPKEENEVIDKFVISRNASVETAKDGSYIYEDLNGKSVGTFQKIIPTSHWEKQENECVKELLEKRNEQAIETCFNNGYTYLLLSYGVTNEVVEIQTEPLIETEDDLIFRYRLLISEGGYDDKPIFYLFQIPTDKKILLEPLSYLLEEEKETPFVKYLYERSKVVEESEAAENQEAEENEILQVPEGDTQEVGVDEE